MSQPTTLNEEWFERAQETIPGGVNSPVRAFGSVGGTPRFIERAHGCRVTDSEGRSYIDYVGSWGPMILGHAHPKILAAVADALPRGTSFGAPTGAEVLLAERIVERVASAEMVRLTCSGTEATMTALRLARGITGRDAFIKFEGNYHGHGDSFLVAAGSGAATHGHPSSPGVPEALARLTRLAPFNDLASVEKIFAAEGDSIAAVIVEPIAGNIGCVPPVEGFLEGLRELSSRHGAVLIFDEVMTGFRVHPGGAQALYDIVPDLTTLGKIVGGGMPIGAIAGPRSVMEQLSPTGPIYQAGTLSGNPLSVAAGLALLEELSRGEEEIYPALEAKTSKLVAGISSALRQHSIPHVTPQVGSMFSVYFREDPVLNFDDAKFSDGERFRIFFHGLLEHGIALAPSPFEAAFVGMAHDDAAIEETISAVETVAALL